MIYNRSLEVGVGYVGRWVTRCGVDPLRGTAFFVSECREDLQRLGAKKNRRSQIDTRSMNAILRAVV